MLDVWYVDHISVQMDCRILLLTVKKVFQREHVGEGAEDMASIDDLGIHEKIAQIRATERQRQ